ncbi:MAG: transglycosylase SLT domain-containing protein [Verrucomicrobiota bacterium]
MKTLLALLVCLGSFSLEAAPWRPDARLLNAVCQVESNSGKYTYGDNGRSLGHFQLQQGAWSDVTEWRKKRNLLTYDYRGNVFNPQISRSYAANYLTILHDGLLQEYRREPSAGELYAAYNLGMTSFRKCNFKLAQVNSTTEARCKLVNALVQ